MTELKPCPFCGGEAKPYDYWNKYLIECDDCVEYGHGAYVVARTEAEAIAAWNTRAERTCKAEYRGSGYDIGGGWYCLTCGGYMHDDLQQDMAYCPNCGARVEN